MTRAEPGAGKWTAAPSSQAASDETAYFFGPPQQRLFGCLHAPDGAAPAAQAVVLCSAFGSEELSAHRAWRHLAGRLARRGHWVLRFDYHACGDSDGDQGEADMLPAWIESVGFAIDEVKRVSGRQQVVLVGLRLGAAIAWQAALGRNDVIGWGGIAAVLSGRLYIRELQALQAAAALPDTMPPEQGLESGGFVMSPATRSAVSALDLRAPNRTAAPHALLVERPGRAPASATLAALQALDVAATHLVCDDLEQIFAEPHRCRTPDSAWQALESWLGTLPSPGARPAEPVGAERGALCGEVTEHAEVITTRSGRLAAIVTRGDQAEPSGRAVVFLNAGAIRRIGPGRIHVDLARELARRGDVAVRLDLCGLGDSEPAFGAEDNVVYSPTAVDEVAQAIEHVMRGPGMRECAVVGLCAGAYHGLRAALAGAPVHTVVAINPLVFYWEQGQTLQDAPRPHEVISEAARYRSIVFTLEPWLKLLRGEANVRRMVQLLSRNASRRVVRAGRELARGLGLPLQQDLGRELAQAGLRGVRFSFIFADAEPGEPLLRDLAGRVVPRLVRSGALRVQHVARADHVFLNLKPRQELIELIRRDLGAATRTARGMPSLPGPDRPARAPTIPPDRGRNDASTAG